MYLTANLNRLGRQQHCFQLIKPSVLALCFDQYAMIEMAIGRNIEHFTADRPKLLNAVQDGNDFGWRDDVT